MTLTCDMKRDCAAPVSHLDEKGYVYCERHGRQRQGTHYCRKLRPHELRRLERGEQLARYWPATEMSAD